MPRIRTIEMDGVIVKISPLSFDEAEAYIKEGKAMVEKKDPKTSDDEWAARTLESVVRTMNKAQNGSGEAWTVKKVREEFDMVLINRIYREFMDLSGLLPAPSSTGEATATSTSR
jgi:hypothetical protein